MRDGRLKRIQSMYPSVRWNAKAPLIDQVEQLAGRVHNCQVRGMQTQRDLEHYASKAKRLEKEIGEYADQCAKTNS